MNVRRGDIIIADRNPTEGTEQRGTRLYLVVQNDVGNENAPRSIVVPSITSSGDKQYPFEVLISASESPLREDSAVLCSQIRTISIEHRIRDSLYTRYSYGGG